MRRPAESPWIVAAHAADSKKASDISILDLSGLNSFTDYFVLCTGSNPRQIQAISDEIEAKLKAAGVTPLSVEGYQHAEWVLLDYGHFLVHVFSEKARNYYDLERLWRQATAVMFDPAQD